MNDFGFGRNPYENLPDDPEEAFLLLEAHYLDECERRLAEAGQDDRLDAIYIGYMAPVAGAINELGLEVEFNTVVPSIKNVDADRYLDFCTDVKRYRTMLLIRKSQRDQGYSVRFDEKARLKIHHHLDQVMGIFQKLEIEDRKRETLIAKLNILQSEVNQPRTRYDRFAALSVEVSGVVGDSVERSKILEILDAVSRLIWGAQTEKQKQLPAPKAPKRIEPPRPKIEPPKRSNDMDDDIPF